jgi:hypothetical protein
MQFTPKTEQEVMAPLLLPAGLYEFKVVDAENCISKSGNDMIKLTLTVWAESAVTIFDYLLEAMAHKLRHFCSATGLIAKYESGTLEDIDCVGKEGLLELIVQKGKQKDDGSMYPDRNAIKDYEAPRENQNTFCASYNKDARNKKTITDDVPF